MGDPMELRIQGYELTLRIDDAHEIGIGNSYIKKEEEIKELKSKIDDPEFYTNSEKLNSLQKSIDSKQEEVNELYATLEAMTN